MCRGSEDCLGSPELREPPRLGQRSGPLPFSPFGPNFFLPGRANLPAAFFHIDAIALQRVRQQVLHQPRSGYCLIHFFDLSDGEALESGGKWLIGPKCVRQQTGFLNRKPRFASKLNKGNSVQNAAVVNAATAHSPRLREKASLLVIANCGRL
jgi:hypothetical protein